MADYRPRVEGVGLNGGLICDWSHSTSDELHFEAGPCRARCGRVDAESTLGASANVSTIQR